MSRHIKLNNSSVSDYFKATALDKGWIKEEVIEKKASGDVNISDNLDVNISTLILQLKEAGLKDLAGELTDSFVYYKRAASGLYNVTKDEYNKLTHLAHPKGSTKLQNMNGDCVVEDTYDTQKALMSLLKEKKRVKKAQSDNSGYKETYSQALYSIKNRFINNIQKEFLKRKKELINNLSDEENYVGKDKEINKLFESTYYGIIKMFIDDSLYTKSPVQSSNLLINKFYNVQELFGSNIFWSESCNSFVAMATSQANELKERYSKKINTKLHDFKLNESPENIYDIYSKENSLEAKDPKLSQINSMIIKIRNYLNKYPADSLTEQRSWLNKVYRVYMNNKSGLASDNLDSIISELNGVIGGWNVK